MATAAKAKEDRKTTKHDVEVAQAQLSMVRTRYAAMVAGVVAICVTVALTLPDIVAAIAGRRTVVEVNTAVTAALSTSITINVVLAFTLIGTLAVAKRGRSRSSVVEAEFQSDEQRN